MLARCWVHAQLQVVWAALRSENSLPHWRSLLSIRNVAGFVLWKLHHILIAGDVD